MQMKSTMSFLFLLQTLINVVSAFKPPPIPPEDINIYRCRNTGNYTSTNYKNNLISALSAVAKNIGAHGGFYQSSAGTTEQVNAVALCPSYLNAFFCESCVNKSIPLLQKNCPNQKEGVTWVASCMVRYSDRKISGVLDDWVWVHLPKDPIVAKVRELDQAVSDLASRLQTQAAGGTSLKKFASGNTTYGMEKVDLYAAMQCTPDLSKEQCTKCLFSTMLTVHSCCSGKLGARMLSPNCYFRYDHDQFDNIDVLPRATSIR
ncbi:hypothetical protein L1887_14211 [Cichorium endivia]|nr:hypothetical protein L1887_14211 [Cichorium endivia]